MVSTHIALTKMGSVFWFALFNSSRRVILRQVDCSGFLCDWHICICAFYAPLGFRLLVSILNSPGNNSIPPLHTFTRGLLPLATLPCRLLICPRLAAVMLSFAFPASGQACPASCKPLCLTSYGAPVGDANSSRRAVSGHELSGRGTRCIE
jgi:hypothetical protein